MSMDMNINGKKLLDLLKKDEDREKVSLYLSKKIYDDFKKACKPVSASMVLEALMKEFLKTTKTKD